jgi:hypothetical protein
MDIRNTKRGAGRISPTADLAFKKVLASEETKDITCGFIADFFGLEVSPRDITIESPYDIRAYREMLEGGKKERSRFRETVKDISLSVEAADMLIEIQVKKRMFYTERSVYYAFRKFCSNYNRPGKMVKDAEGKPTRYSSLRPVYSMNVLGYRHFEDEEALHLFTLYDRKLKLPFGRNLIQIGYFELGKPCREQANLEQWREYFKTGLAPAGAPE